MIGNIEDMMKKAQEMQSRLGAIQEELENLTVTGQAAGGTVTVTMTARTHLKDVHIDPSLVKPEESEILEDLITAAFNNAKARAEQAAREKMAEATGGMPLPPGFDSFL